MRFFRRALAAFLSLAIVGAAPGGTGYQAAAQVIAGAAGQARPVVGGAMGAVTAAGRIQGVGLSLELGPASLSGMPALSQPEVVAGPGAESSYSALEAMSLDASPLYGAEAAPAGKEAGSWRALLNDSRPAAPSAEQLSSMSTGETRAAGHAAMDAVLGTRARAVSADAVAVESAQMGSAAPLAAAAGKSADSAISVPAVQTKAPAKAPFYAAAMAGFGGAVLSAGALVSIAVYVVLVIPSLIVHEYAHAKVAEWLGDSTPRVQGRLNFRPRGLSFYKKFLFNFKGSEVSVTLPRFEVPGFFSHIDPLMTVALPIVSILFNLPLFGQANPVLTSPFNSVRDQMKIAAAGPASNFALALLGAAAFGGLAAAGVAGLAATVVSIFTFYNIFLGILNLIPLSPFDGEHVVRGILDFFNPSWGDAFAAFNAGPVKKLGILGTLIVFMVLGPALSAMAMGATGWLLGTAAVLGGVQLASAGAPAMAAVGLLLGSLATDPAAKPAQEAPAVVAPQTGPLDLVLVFPESAKKITQDAHLSWVDVTQAGGVDLHFAVKQRLSDELKGVGLDEGTLRDFEVTPRAVYQRINGATVRLPAEKSAEFSAFLAAKGVKVFANARRQIIMPVPLEPETADPKRGGGTTMDEVLKATKADAVVAEARKRWGDPNMGWAGRLALRLTKAVIPQPAIGVIDSGADTTHPFLKWVAKVVNATTGPNIDDIGHGTWVTGMVLNFARWSRNLTHYKTFVGGGATLDDILKALTMAGNDGNLVISNSWGSDDGDPNSPDSLLVLKLAQEGHIMVFAAGNSGPSANSVGSPAIVRYKQRVLAVAAADKNKKIARFSSRGPGSPKTSETPGYPHVPDVTAVGYNVEGPWPVSVGGADRTDGANGPVKAISGTSMSTPDFAGAIALLCMLFGVTEKGEKLDQIVDAVMATLDKTAQGRDAEGEGHLNLNAAYEALKLVLEPVTPNLAARMVVKLMGGAGK